MTVWDVVAMGRSPYTGFWGHLTDEDKRIIRESLDMVGIGPTPTLPREGERSFVNRRITEISDGERQKVMIAKAIAQQTPVILLPQQTPYVQVADTGGKRFKQGDTTIYTRHRPCKALWRPCMDDG